MLQFVNFCALLFNSVIFEMLDHIVGRERERDRKKSFVVVVEMEPKIRN